MSPNKAVHEHFYVIFQITHKYWQAVVLQPAVLQPADNLRDVSKSDRMLNRRFQLD